MPRIGKKLGARATRQPCVPSVIASALGTPLGGHFLTGRQHGIILRTYRGQRDCLGLLRRADHALRGSSSRISKLIAISAFAVHVRSTFVAAPLPIPRSVHVFGGATGLGANLKCIATRVLAVTGFPASGGGVPAPVALHEIRRRQRQAVDVHWDLQIDRLGDSAIGSNRNGQLSRALLVETVMDSLG